MAALKVVGGRCDGKLIPLNVREFLIGRDATCHLRPNSELVSGHHCFFTVNADAIEITDLGSIGGTFLNGIRIVGRQTTGNGDRIQVGSLIFELVVDHAPAPPVVAAASEPPINDDANAERLIPDTAIAIPDTVELPAEQASASVEDPSSTEEALPPYPLTAPTGSPLLPAFLDAPGGLPPPGYPIPFVLSPVLGYLPPGYGVLTEHASHAGVQSNVRGIPIPGLPSNCCVAQGYPWPFVYQTLPEKAQSSFGEVEESEQCIRFNRLRQELRASNLIHRRPSWIYAGLLQKERIGLEILRRDFDAVLVFDCGVCSANVLPPAPDKFLRYICAHLESAFEYDGCGEMFHPERITQILRDAEGGLFLFLRIEWLSSQVLQQLRGLGFAQMHHRVVYCGVNSYFDGRSLSVDLVRLDDGD